MIELQFDMEDQTGRMRRIFIAHPAGEAPQAGWPVIWLLDGNMTFPLAVKEKPQALLAGIGTPLEDRQDIVKQRYFDLTTPAPAETIPSRPDQPTPPTGGADDYRHFILNQLQPSIAALFAVDLKHQTLYGHSLGGLFVVQTLLQNPGNFQTYCAADPSIWWNRHEIMPALAGFSITAPSYPQPKIQLSLSGKKTERPGLTKQDAERIRQLRSGPNGKAVYDRLKQIENIKAVMTIHRQETHGSLVAVSLHDCLLFSAVLPYKQQTNEDKK